MLKFEFIRMQPPSSPTWNKQQNDWTTPANGTPENEHHVVWNHMWNWLSGEQPNGHTNGSANGKVGKAIDALSDQNPTVRLNAADELGLMGAAAEDAIAALVESLDDQSEPVAVNAAYALANMGKPAVEALSAALKHSSKQVVHQAAYGLSAIGAPAFSGLADALDHDSPETRGAAAFALGELLSGAEDALPALGKLMNDDSVWVRRNTVEALGTIGGQEAVQPLINGLTDSDVQVRFTAGLSLARMGQDANEAVPALKQALNDENRYVRANAIDALARIGTPDANQVLLQSLLTARWCPSTTPDSTY